MGFELVGEWGKFKQFVAEMKEKIPEASKLALHRVGLKAQRDLRTGVLSGAPGGKPYPPNHPFTVQRKGSSKPMVHHGDFVGAINYQMVADNAVFVGIKRGARKHGSLDTVNLAEIHERGCIIKVTPKMRAYLHSQGLHLKPSTQYIRIPPRPTFGPVWEAENENYAKLLVETVAKEVARLL